MLVISIQLGSNSTGLICPQQIERVEFDPYWVVTSHGAEGDPRVSASADERGVGHGWIVRSKGQFTLLADKRISRVA